MEPCPKLASGVTGYAGLPKPDLSHAFGGSLLSGRRWIKLTLSSVGHAAKISTLMSTADLMRVLEGIADSVVRLDGNAKYVSMNRSAEDTFRHLGHDPTEMIGRSVWEVFPDVRGTIVESELRRAFDDEIPIHYEFFYPRNQRWYQTDGFPASPGVVLIFRDITSRKKKLDSSSG